MNKVGGTDAKDRTIKNSIAAVISTRVFSCYGELNIDFLLHSG